MASKRQRKKQQAKKNMQLLQAVGVTDKKVLREYKNRPKQTEQLYKQKRRNLIANERSDFMRNVLGLPMDKSNQSKRYWSEKRWEAWKSDQLEKKRKEEERRERERKKRERKERDDQDLYLLIFWKEKTEGYADESIIEDFKHEYRHLDNDYLIRSIIGFLSAKMPSLIGTYNIQVVRGNQRQQVKNFMKSFDTGMLADWNNWLLVYEGKADPRRYKELLLAIHTVVRLLYDNEEKAGFINDLIMKFLPRVNRQTASRLAKDLNFRSGGF